MTQEKLFQEKIEEIMQDREARFIEAEKKQKLILKKEVFSSNYLPDKIYHRDKEIENLTEHFIATRHQKYCSDLSIYGVTGSGKTLVTKLVFKTLSKDIENTYYVFVPCNEHNTPSAITRFILTQIKEDWKGRGTSDFIQQIKDEIKDKLLVLILDEIDIFLKNDKSNESLIQILSDWNNCVLIFISNDPGWHECINDHRTISRLHFTNMIFEPYESDQIYDILKDRSLLGLAPGVITDDDLWEIAKFTAQYSGDARVAIKLLAQAALYAERDHKANIDFAILERAINALEEDNKINFIDSLPPQHRLILASIYLVNKNLKKSNLETIYREYTRMLFGSKRWRTLSKNTMRVYLDELETYRLIEKETGKGRGRGKGRDSTLIFPAFDTDKFEQRIMSEMRRQ